MEFVKEAKRNKNEHYSFSPSANGVNVCFANITHVLHSYSCMCVVQTHTHSFSHERKMRGKKETNTAHSPPNAIIITIFFSFALFLVI